MQMCLDSAQSLLYFVFLVDLKKKEASFDKHLRTYGNDQTIHPF